MDVGRVQQPPANTSAKEVLRDHAIEHTQPLPHEGYTEYVDRLQLIDALSLPISPEENADGVSRRLDANAFGKDS